MKSMEPSALSWRKSSHSTGGGPQCVEVAVRRGSVAVRDSKDADGPALLLDRAAFRGLTDRIKRGDYDR